MYCANNPRDLRVFELDTCWITHLEIGGAEAMVIGSLTDTLLGCMLR